jgi:hypothetical protein
MEDEPLTEEEVLQAQVDLARRIFQTRLNLVTHSDRFMRDGSDEPRRLVLRGQQACAAARSASPSPPPSQGHADDDPSEEEEEEERIALTRRSLRSPSSLDAQPAATLQLRQTNLSPLEQQIEWLEQQVEPRFSLQTPIGSTLDLQASAPPLPPADEGHQGSTAQGSRPVAGGRRRRATPIKNAFEWLQSSENRSVRTASFLNT